MSGWLDLKTLTETAKRMIAEKRAAESGARMTDALKRIEEKHDRECHRCFDPEDPGPCDVVKLARALEILKATARRVYEKYGTDWTEWTDLRDELQNAERTLEEVAE